MQTRSPVTIQQLKERREEPLDADTGHALKVRMRRNAYEAARKRQFRRDEAKERGRSVRPYHRKPPGDEALA